MLRKRKFFACLSPTPVSFHHVRGWWSSSIIGVGGRNVSSFTMTGKVWRLLRSSSKEGSAMQFVWKSMGVLAISEKSPKNMFGGNCWPRHSTGDRWSHVRKFYVKKHFKHVVYLATNKLTWGNRSPGTPRVCVDVVRRVATFDLDASFF